MDSSTQRLKDMIKRMTELDGAPETERNQLNEMVNMNVSMSGETADDVATLMKLLQNAGMNDAAPVSQDIMPVRQDMERLAGIMGEPGPGPGDDEMDTGMSGPEEEPEDDEMDTGMSGPEEETTEAGPGKFKKSIKQMFKGPGYDPSLAEPTDPEVGSMVYVQDDEMAIRGNKEWEGPYKLLSTTFDHPRGRRFVVDFNGKGTESSWPKVRPAEPVTNEDGVGGEGSLDDYYNVVIAALRDENPNIRLDGMGFTDDGKIQVKDSNGEEWIFDPDTNEISLMQESTNEDSGGDAKSRELELLYGKLQAALKGDRRAESQLKDYVATNFTGVDAGRLVQKVKKMDDATQRELFQKLIRDGQRVNQEGYKNESDKGVNSGSIPEKAPKNNTVLSGIKSDIKEYQQEIKDAKASGYDEDVRMMKDRLSDLIDQYELVKSGGYFAGVDTSVKDEIIQRYKDAGGFGKTEGYKNEPDEDYQDTGYMTKDISGGLNRQKKSYSPAAGGDNPMAVENVKDRLYAMLSEKKAKPDFLDVDKDGDKKEPMKKAAKDKKAGPKKGVNPFAKKEEMAAEGRGKVMAGKGRGKKIMAGKGRGK
jgi:hypothetical protein